ncbi:MAG: hypothetical protein GXY87_07255 [Tissierellia bacterium]|nr:hypothetical protein [Tissierellia bacterium]
MENLDLDTLGVINRSKTLDLRVNRKYKMISDGRKLVVKVLKEYESYYLIRVNGKYNTTVSKFGDNSLKIL